MKSTGTNTEVRVFLCQEIIMNVHHGLIFCMLLCLAIPAGAAGVLTPGISSVAATTETPPFNVSVYIRDAQDAIAERNWTSALLLTTRGLSWYPDSADLLCLQGYTYRKVGQYQKSVDTVSGLELTMIDSCSLSRRAKEACTQQ